MKKKKNEKDNRCQKGEHETIGIVELIKLFLTKWISRRGEGKTNNELIGLKFMRLFVTLRDF